MCEVLFEALAKRNLTAKAATVIQRLWRQRARRSKYGKNMNSVADFVSMSVLREQSAHLERKKRRMIKEMDHINVF